MSRRDRERLADIEATVVAIHEHLERDLPELRAAVERLTGHA